jgi:hypothetical protein
MVTTKRKKKTMVVPVPEDNAPDLERQAKVVERIKENPKLHEALQWIREWQRRETNHDLRSRYELGVYCRSIKEDEEENDGAVFGKNAVGWLSEALGGEDRSLILACIRFANAFTEEQLDNLCSIVRKDGHLVSWSHVRLLAGEMPPTVREALLMQCVDECWTSTQLAHKIRETLTPNQPVGKGGRKVMAPKNLKGLLEQVGTFTEKINKRAENWNGGQSSPAAMVLRMDATEVSEKLIQELMDKRNSTEEAIQKLILTKRELDKAIARAQRAYERALEDGKARAAGEDPAEEGRGPGCQEENEEEDEARAEMAGVAD